MKRRHFLLGTVGAAGAAGALGVGWLAAPLRSRLLPAEPLPPLAGRTALNGWVRVGNDDSVTVVMSQAEMGQGVHTGLAMLLAEELDVPWAQIRLEQAGMDPIYNNQAVIIDALPFAPQDHGMARRATQHALRRVLRAVPGLAGTGGSGSIRDQWLVLRQAGASARAMLIAAAAQRWRVSAAQCRTEAGMVLHASGRSARYGELAALAATLPLPRDPVLKDPSQYRFIGQALPRLDTAAKVNGSAGYAIDARPPGLLFAAPLLCPTLGGEVAHFDARRALAMPGVRKVVKLPVSPGGLGLYGSTSGGIAVIANNSWNARRAAAVVEVEWDHGSAASLSDSSLRADLERALQEHRGHARLVRGDVEAALRGASRRITARYHVPLLAHATMEPMNATVQFRDGRATVWAPTQAAGFAREAVAKQLGIRARHVEVHVPYLGGGFGRRYGTDFLTQAAAVARETGGAPVQLLWPREQDIAHDYYRPAFVVDCAAGLDAGGRLVAWQMTTAGSSLGVPALLASADDGAFNTAYDFPNTRVAHQTMEHPVPMGIWRSVGHSYNAFFVESFIDEVAAAAGQDPLQLRRTLLAQDARHLAVLDRLARLCNWGTPLPAGTDGVARARGLALHRAFGSIVGQVAEVELGADGQIRVPRVYCVLDCGVAVNPGLIRAQIEGGIVFGLSAALQGEITLKDGQVQQSNFHDYAPLRMAQCPQMQVEIIEGDREPGGIGEVGVPPIAPAVANALFALTGKRLRSLPLRMA